MKGEKAALRALLKQQRQALLAQAAGQSDAAITAGLLAWPLFARADVLLTYVSTPGEVDTLALIRAALAQGKTVAVPRCLPERRMVFGRISALEELVPGAYGIPEPPPECPTAEAGSNSLCLVPGLAFDSRGNRIGYGGGYYDRFLAGFPGISVGLVRQDFLKTALPAEATDRRVDYLAAETGIIQIP